MARNRSNPLKGLLDSPPVREAARALSPHAYQHALRQLERQRGHGLFFPALGDGTGGGARVGLADGSTRIDFVSGIGVHGFGHADPDLLETAVAAAR